jgi:hypothetical protein
MAELADERAFARNSDYVVVLRDPVQSFASYVRRFWPGCKGKPRPGTLSLDEELRLVDHSAAQLDAFVSNLPCERTLFLSYDLLTRLPWEQHAAALARFVGLEASSPAIRTFFSKVHARRQGLHDISTRFAGCAGEERKLLPAWLQHCSTAEACTRAWLAGMRSYVANATWARRFPNAMVSLGAVGIGHGCGKR